MNKRKFPVSSDEATKFLETACRNWRHVPHLDNDDIADVVETLERFLADKFRDALTVATVPALSPAMTADMPDATQVAREAVAAFYDANDLKALCEVVLSGGLDNNANYPVRGAILGARAMQAAMAGREVNGVDGATPAPVISEETINTVRAHAIHNAAQGGMPQAEAEDHFGKPTPAPDATGLVATLRRGTGIRDSVLYTEADAHAADCTMKEAASRIEALEAEVARQKARADDMHRRAQQAEAPKMAARDVAKVMWRFISKAHDRYYQQKARATTAEAERDALKAEVERLKRLGGQLANIVSHTMGRYPAHEQGPARETLNQWDGRAALAPAKAGG